MPIRRPHRFLYVSCFANDFVFAYGVYAVMFSIRGLSTMEISAVLAFWALSAAILEIPTGALADYLGRKVVVAIAPLLNSLCFITWIFARGDAWIYGLGFFFWGFGEALRSGSWEALVFDSLKARGEEMTYEKLLGRFAMLSQIAVAGGMAIGGLLTPLGLEAVMLASLPAPLIASVAVLPLAEPPRTEAQGRGLRQYFMYLRIAWREIKASKMLRVIVLAQIGIGMLWTLEEYDQLFFQEAGVPLIAIGGVCGLFFGGRSVTALFAHRLKGRRRPIQLLTIAAGALTLAAAVKLALPSIAPLLLAYMCGAMVSVLLEGRFQACVESTARATVTSVAAFLSNAITVAEMLLLGWISLSFGVRGIYLAGGAVVLIFGVLVMRLFSRRAGPI